MKSSQDDKFASLAVPPAFLVANPITPELRSYLDGNPQGVVVIVYMKPERVHGIGELMRPERVQMGRALGPAGVDLQETEKPVVRHPPNIPAPPPSLDSPPTPPFSGFHVPSA